jgi:hypothetical protein
LADREARIIRGEEAVRGPCMPEPRAVDEGALLIVAIADGTQLDREVLGHDPGTAHRVCSARAESPDEHEEVPEHPGSWSRNSLALASLGLELHLE